MRPVQGNDKPSSGAAPFDFHIQEGEETVYWFWENQYQKLKGYFIFYERNPQMQKYMAEHCSPRKVEKEMEKKRTGLL